MEGHFLVRQIYEDELTYNLIGAAVEVLKIPATTILELFGKTFFEFCQDSGYDKILQVLGATPRDFLTNLDALHDHLGTLYPGMKAPSFRCTERPEDGALILHYYSDRAGLEHIVIGIVKTVASRLHNTEVEVELIQTKDESDHVQFLITEKFGTKKSQLREMDEIETLSLEPKVSPATFCRIFPFHIMFDAEMKIVQTGFSVARIIPKVSSTGCRITDILDPVSTYSFFFEEELFVRPPKEAAVSQEKPGALPSPLVCGIQSDQQDQTPACYPMGHTSKLTVRMQLSAHENPLISIGEQPARVLSKRYVSWVPHC
uniref:guanylate cyclase n=1 Tax=Diabrotica virgifera virgifera TaxID=50390 RepID=A0A6P7F963_DIAVI